MQRLHYPNQLQTYLENLKKRNELTDEKSKGHSKVIDVPFVRKGTIKVPKAPRDVSITTLFMGNISSEEITEEVVCEQME